MARDLDAWITSRVTDVDTLLATTLEEASARISDADILLSGSFPEDLLRSAPRLQWVQVLMAGVEDVVPIARRHPQIVFSRMVDAFSGYIAEYVFAELLARERGLDRTRAAQAERRWDRFVARTLAGKTLGVAGLGSIGTEVVRKARAFDMRVNGLSRTVAKSALVDRHFLPDRWCDFVADLDMLVLTLPRTSETEGVINQDVLSAMRSDAVLVNVGRGALVDEGSLLWALRHHRIGAAILDVFQNEPVPVDSPLWSAPNLVITPHLSGPTTAENAGAFFLDNLHRWRAGAPLRGTIDLDRGY
jgi:phosphoglycerate dehydrogenase-like enzyme